MSPYDYFPTFIITLTAICIAVGVRFLNSPDYMLQEKGDPNIWTPLILCIIMTLFLGGRPVSRQFGDTVNYAMIYTNTLPTINLTHINWKGEWFWEMIMQTCKTLGLSVSSYFTVIETGYIMSAYLAFKRFVPKNLLLGILFMFTSLMFYTFGVNGIRNGLACHITLLGFTLVFDAKYFPAVVVLGLAYSIHHSILLPVAAFLAAFFVVKDAKMAMWIWLASILLSLVAGARFEAFFSSLGFDDRMTTYTNYEDDEYTKTGFRWDFLLYSAMPVFMMWHVLVKHKISENWYRVLCITYCLANSFWVLVIRAAYSNRFAYLSWFMYPLIIAYPIIMLPVWEDQDQKTAYILFAYVTFTILMNIMWHNL